MRLYIIHPSDKLDNKWMLSSDWYGATVILVPEAHFALTIALHETTLSYRLL